MAKRENRSLGQNSAWEQRDVSAENIHFTADRTSSTDRAPFDKPESFPESTVIGSDVDFRNEDSKSENLLSQAIKGEYSYGKLGLILGLSAIVGGVILCLNGVVGSSSWTASVLNMKSIFPQRIN